MLKLDLLRLRQTESSGDVCKWFLRKDDRAGSHGSDLADELNVFDGFGEELQTAAILFEKTKTRTIDLAVDEQTDQPFMAQTGSERDFALRYIESRFCVAESLIVQARAILVRRIAHRSVIAIDIESAHS